MTTARTPSRKKLWGKSAAKFELRVPPRMGEWGSSSMFQTPAGARKLKHEPKFEEATFLGIVTGGREFCVADCDGMVRGVQNIKRLPLSERLSGQAVLAVKGVPWDPRSGL